ncbi:MAG: CBS domain-containing protein [Chloroflexi bacterium]|nr:CBS domain-containing protein [Chloroflexota bacterium]
MRARDIMTRDVVTVRRDTPVREVLALLIAHRISGVPVVDDHQRILGIISEGDLILRERALRRRTGNAFLFQQLFGDHAKLAEEYRKAHGRVAREVMTRQVISCPPSAPVEEIAHIMAEKRIKRVPIVEDDRLVGLVSRADVVKVAMQRLLALESSDTVEALSDEEIAKKLVELLRQEPWAEVERLQITVRDGVVLLEGSAETVAEREAIELAARRIPGVLDVRDSLNILPSLQRPS